MAKRLTTTSRSEGSFRRGRRAFCSWATVAGASLFLPSSATAQATKSIPPFQIPPDQMGLDLPSGAVQQGKGRTVQTNDDDGRGVIGRLHVGVGDAAIVMLPDGQLVVRKAGEFTQTDRPFQPEEMSKLAERLVRDEFPGFKTKSTRHYIYIYNTSDEFQLATSRILETMLPGIKGYAEVQKIEVTEPVVPLIVVMFRTEDEFQAHNRMPDGVVAYYHTLSNRVFMYEQSQLAQVRPDLAIQQSISTIAHEGVHQILHNIGVQQRLSVWPMWLSEGLAEYCAPTSTGARLKWKGPGQVNDLRMFELEQYLKSQGAKTPTGELIEHTVMAPRLTSTGYASAWALTHYLAKVRRVEFNEYVREVSKLQPLEASGNITAGDLVRENMVLFKKFFGDDLPAVETRLIAHLKKQPYVDPFHAMPHYVATIAFSDGRKVHRDAVAFHTPTSAQAWMTDSLDKVPQTLRAGAQTGLRVFRNRATAEAFVAQWVAGR
jgi:hypothetical protein